MPIRDITARFRELGRIRMGYQEPTGKTYQSGPMKGRAVMRPVKLDRFRLTSQQKPLIEHASSVYGGPVQPWDNDGTPEWQVVIEAEQIPVMLAVADEEAPCFEQWYELWTGGGLVRRCDGIRIDAPDPGDCACPADPQERAEQATKGQACKPTSRLRVMLPDLPDLGVWRLESHGFYAASELAAIDILLRRARAAGATLIPAELRLVEKEGARRQGEQRRKFYVPAVTFHGRLQAFLDTFGALDGGPSAMAGGIGAATPALPAAAAPAAGRPQPQRSIIDDLYDRTTARANALDEDDRGALLEMCAKHEPPIPIHQKIRTLPQDMVRTVAGFLDQLEQPKAVGE